MGSSAISGDIEVMIPYCLLVNDNDKAGQIIKQWDKCLEYSNIETGTE